MFEILTTAVMKSSVFWDIMPYKLPVCCLLHAGILLDVFFDPEDGGDVFFPDVS
jgi:hypothetical protein